jgi:hypothetical protein
MYIEGSATVVAQYCCLLCRQQKGTLKELQEEEQRELLELLGVLDFVHRPGIYKIENTSFRKLELFPKNDAFWDVTPCGSCKNQGHNSDPAICL